MEGIKMIDKKMLQALNEQVNHEFYAAYLYLSMSAYFASENFKGFANWLRKQANEEVEHAMKIFDHINERGDKVVLTQIETPKEKWKSPLEAFTDAYKHEQKVTGLIHKLVDLATKVKDHASYSFLQWYVNEQVEEEAQTLEIVDKLKMIKDHTSGLLLLDKELGSRE